MRPDQTVSKLIGLNTDLKLVKLIQDFFTSRQHCVKFRGYISIFRDVTIGILHKGL